MLTKEYDSLKSQIKENEFDFFRFYNSEAEVIKIKNFCNKSLDVLSLYKNVVIIGMGASVLNIKAVCSSIESSTKNVVYLDSLYRSEIDKKLSKINLDETVFFSISKSGNTHETFVITEYIIQSKNVNLKNIYVISPSKDTLLFDLVKTYKLNHIEHDVNGSGRFNIISGATLLPAMHLGLDIGKIISSAKKYLDNFFNDGKGILITVDWYLKNYKLNRTILVLFNYVYPLRGLLEWKRQMLSESLGKDGFGITPIISEGPFDEHSQLQLYLDGPDNKCFKIIREIESQSDSLKKAIDLHNDNMFKTFTRQKNECINFLTIDKVNEDLVAKIIIETILIIILISIQVKINPFDQAKVDGCKIKL